MPVAPTSTTRHVEDPQHLTDGFGRFHNYLRISLTERCNLRCTYCMPAEGVPLSPASRLLSSDELGRLGSIFARMGTTKVRLTGGEPTLRPDVVDICAALAEQPGIQSVGMTTNGVNLLKKRENSTLLEALADAGLRSLNVSLDSMDAATFATMTRRPMATHGRVLDALEATASLGLRVKVNCVVMRGSNHDALGEFVQYFLERPHLGVDVRFIEWMPFSANDWKSGTLVPAAEMRHLLGAQGLDLQPLEPDDPHDTTRWYSVDNTRIGIISSMTDHFCAGCNRVRVTADGALKTCLFGNDALSLRDLLRAGNDDLAIAQAVQGALANKHFAHGGRKHGAQDIADHAHANRPMILIGG